MPAALAKATGTAERYVQEWLSAQAASGYVEYDRSSGKFSMLPEQALALADEDSPVFLGAIGNLVGATFLDEPKITDAFKTGKGVGWNRRSECLFCGTARFFRTSYKHHLVQAMAAGAGGRRRQADEGRRRGRYRLRARRLDAADGGGVSEINLLRLRLSRRLDPGGADDPHGRRDCRTASTSKPTPPRHSLPRGMIWCASLIACTTWATRSAPSSIPVPPSPTTAPAC